MKTPAELQRQRSLVYIVPSGPCLYIYDKKTDFWKQTARFIKTDD